MVTPCPVNYYGTTSCFPCPQLSSTLGKTGATTISECRCIPDFWLNRDVCIPCLFPSWKYRCPGNVDCLDDPVLKQGGWWVNPSGTKDFYSALFVKCPKADWCPTYRGDSPCTSAAGERCQFGHNSASPLCAQCDVAFRRTGAVDYTCTKCPNVPVLLVIISAIVSILTMGLLIWIFLPPIERTLSLRFDKRELKRTMVIPKLRIFIFYVSGLLCIGGLALDYGMAQFDSSEGLDPLIGFFKFLLQVSLNSSFLFSASFIDCLNYGTIRLIAPIIFAAIVPLLYFLVVSLTFLVTFVLFTQNAPNEVEGIPFTRPLGQWRSFLGLRTTVRFGWVLILTAMCVIPSLTVHYCLGLPCMFISGVGNVLVYYPYVPCATPIASRGQAISVVMLAIISFGLPIAMIILMIVVRFESWEERPRWKLVLGLFTDGYSFNSSRIPIFPLRFLTLVVMILLSIELSGQVGSSYLKIFLLLAITTCWIFYHHRVQPYENLVIDPSTIEKKRALRRPMPIMQRFKMTMKRIFCPQNTEPNLLNRLDGLGLWSNFITYAFVLIGLELHNTASSIIILLLIICLNIYTLFTIAIYLLNDVFEKGFKAVLLDAADSVRRCYKRVWREKTGKTFITDTTQEIVRGSQNFGIYSALQFSMEGADAGMTKLHSIFIKAIRLSPFPPEALNQISCLLSFMRLGDLTMIDATTHVILNGHIEPQPATLALAVPFLSSSYLDISQQSTRAEFIELITEAIDWVAQQLGIHRNTQILSFKSSTIARKYTFTRMIVEAKSEKQKGFKWKEILGVKNERDVKTRFLAASKFFISIEDINRVKADFQYLFPSANPVVRVDQSKLGIS